MLQACLTPWRPHRSQTFACRGRRRRKHECLVAVSEGKPPCRTENHHPKSLSVRCDILPTFHLNAIVQDNVSHFTKGRILHNLALAHNPPRPPPPPDLNPISFLPKPHTHPIPPTPKPPLPSPTKHTLEEGSTVVGHNHKLVAVMKHLDPHIDEETPDCVCQVIVNLPHQDACECTSRMMQRKLFKDSRNTQTNYNLRGNNKVVVICTHIYK
jgi:hypothetical protein